MANLGGAGMFVGIVTSIIAVEIYRVTDKSKFKITMPDNVPPAVARSFESLTPTLIVMLLIGSITYYLGFDWHICRELSGTTSSSSGLFIECLAVSLLTTFFWFFGIHGASIVGSLARPLWLQLLEENTTAKAAGEALPRIAAEPFTNGLFGLVVLEPQLV